MKLAALAHSTLLLGFTLLYATAADLPVHTAKGEGRSFLRDKRPVIQFPAKSPKGSSATWDLENPIQPGWHTVEIQFGPERNCRKLVDLAFLDYNSTTVLSINLYHVPSKTASRPVARFGIYLTKPCNQVQWIKNQSREMASAPLLGLSIRPGRPTPTDASMEVLPAVSRSGRLLVPDDLGNGIIRALASKPVSLKWTQKNGKSFTTPSATETTAFLESDLCDITITGGTIDQLTLERRFESTSPVSSKGLEKPIIPLIQDGRHLQTLKINGKGLDPKSVRLADFPNGARMAAVLSWDDGVAQDKRAAEIMQKWGWRASFFFNRNSVMVECWKELEDLEMEVASHSWSHPFYPLQSPSRCLDESMLMRRFLESKVGHPVISFAYPYNYGAAYDSRGDYVLRANRDSGYLSGRSTMNGPLSLESLGEPLAMKTDAHFLTGHDRISSSWKRAAETTGGIFYIWGHTYEIVSETDWTAFETMLKEYSRHPEAWYASQGDLMVWKHLRDHTKLSASGNSNELVIQLDAPSIHPWWAARVPIAITVAGKMTRATSGDQALEVVHSDIQIKEHKPAH